MKWRICGGFLFPAEGETVTAADVRAMLSLFPGMPRRVKSAERWRWDGTIDFTTRDRRGRFTSRTRVHNTITTAGKNLVRDYLRGAATDGLIRYVALGNDNGSILPLAAGNTSLGAEQFRKPVTAFNPAGLVDAQNLTRGIIASFEACSSGGSGTNFTINEIGWYAGPTATATPGSGVLVARVLYTRAKSSTESLQVDRTDSW